MFTSQLEKHNISLENIFTTHVQWQIHRKHHHNQYDTLFDIWVLIIPFAGHVTQHI